MAVPRLLRAAVHGCQSLTNVDFAESPAHWSYRPRFRTLELDARKRTVTCAIAGAPCSRATLTPVKTAA